MKMVFWISLGFILYIYAGYPLIMWMLARFRPHHWNLAPVTPSISIVLAVHNGVSLLTQKIDHLLGLDYPNILEIIVVSDGSFDGTAKLLAQYRHPRVIPIILEEHGGKAVALNAGVARAQGDVILFVDIRPEIAPCAIQQLVSNFADPKVACVAGELILRRDGHEGATAAVGGLYWRYEQWIRRCEALSDSAVGVYGGFYAIRRDLATTLPDGLILDDVFQPLSIVRKGFRCVLDPLAHVYDTWPQKLGGEFHRKVRTLAGNFQLIQLAPWTLGLQNRVLFQFVSHKVLRLAAPYLLFLFVVSTVALAGSSPFYATLAALQLLSLGTAVTGLLFRIPMLYRFAAPASGLLMLNAAAVVALQRFLFTRGPLWKIWNVGQPKVAVFTPQPSNMTAPEPVAVAPATDTGTSLRIHANRR